MFSIVGSLVFGAVFGVFATSVFALLLSGSAWASVAKDIGFVAGLLVTPFLVLGYPQPFFRHSVASEFTAGFAFVLGVLAWAWHVGWL